MNKFVKFSNFAKKFENLKIPVLGRLTHMFFSHLSFRLTLVLVVFHLVHKHTAMGCLLSTLVLSFVWLFLGGVCFLEIFRKQLLIIFHIYHSMYFGPGGFACATRGGVAMRSWPLLLPTFALSHSLSFFYVFCFWPTLGKLPRRKFRFPQYFGITRRNMKKVFWFNL